MKIGDYVRTKKGGIGKIVKIEPFMNKTHIFLDSKQGDITFYTNEKVLKVNSEESIIKSSPNIIDLIEVGDYVNGCPVLHKENNELVCGLLLRYKEENIQNVVTKEQFSQMKYKVGE